MEKYLAAIRSRFFSEALSPHWRILIFSLAVLLFAVWSETDSGRVWLLGFRLPPTCAFQVFTGLDCPGCGLTRSVILAVHGSFRESYLMHIWGIPLFILLFLQIPYRIGMIASCRSTLMRSRPDARRWLAHFVLLSLILPWGAKTLFYLADLILDRV